MERLGHYLKPGVKATAPGVLFALACTPSVETTEGDESRQWWTWGGCDVVLSRYRLGKWKPYEHSRCETVDELHRWMRERADPQRRNYVVTPNGQEDAAQVRLWDHIDKGRVRFVPMGRVWQRAKDGDRAQADTVIRRVTTTPRTFILDFFRDKCRWIWLSGRQFFDAPESDLANCTENGWVDTGQYDTPGAFITRTTRERAVLWLTLFQRLSDWWLRNSKAPFGMTGSALSMGMLRTHIAPKALCTHSDADVHQLERDACFGGRAQTHYYGTVGQLPTDSLHPAEVPGPNAYGHVSGPMVNLDVRSMYPWLLRERDFPRKLKEYRENARPADALAAASCMGVIARVTVETERADYPERVGDRIYYRVGRFTTILTGPELLDVAKWGKVTRCHALAVYHLGRPFQRAAGALIRMREQARERGEPAWELFAKLMGTGLAGKLAQKRGNWEFRSAINAPLRYGEWYDKSTVRPAMTRFRAIAGLTWEWAPDTTGAGPYTAAFAYLTAYGRLYLRGLVDVCPPRSVLSVDTDGLWCLATARDALAAARRLGGESAGSLRVVGESAYGRFLGPRHYYSADGWVLAGFSAPIVCGGGSAVESAARYTACGSRGGGAPRGTAVRSRTSFLKVEHPGQKIGPDGWALPTRRR